MDNSLDNVHLLVFLLLPILLSLEYWCSFFDISIHPSNGIKLNLELIRYFLSRHLLGLEIYHDLISFIEGKLRTLTILAPTEKYPMLEALYSD